jgi:hypothetical protein
MPQKECGDAKLVYGDAQLPAAQISITVNHLNNAQDLARPLVDWALTLLGNPLPIITFSNKKSKMSTKSN